MGYKSIEGNEMDYFLDAYRQFTNFQGRASRKQYWMFYLFYVIFYIMFAVLDDLLQTGGLFMALFALVSILPNIAIVTRRLHDIDKSGWWQLLIFIPIIGAIVLLVFLVMKGTEGENRFGSVPLN